MSKDKLPLNEVSIEQLFNGGDACIYEIPIYQRNYAWENDEIKALVQDVYDAYKKPEGRPYYIGTLVSYHKGDNVYEVIDGQQRLTTISLLLKAMGVQYDNKLTYRAREKSDKTLNAIPKFDIEEKDAGIENGYKYSVAAIEEIKANGDFDGFATYFKSKVHIIHYRVPKDIDLNHYFEIMNSRGEQLEKHEIVKAKLMQNLDSDDEVKLFNCIWECCSEMSVYAQQNIKDIKAEYIFGSDLSGFISTSFDDLLKVFIDNKKEGNYQDKSITIADIIDNKGTVNWDSDKDTEKKDSFQPIIDFPNFLLIVLKILRLSEKDFSTADYTLDDKELINEFDKADMDPSAVKNFSFTLLKARFLLDNYVVHHSKEDDTLENNPWKLQVWHKDREAPKGQLRNLCEGRQLKPIQDRLSHILSMFEVSFTARQRKNYLFYCLLYLMNADLQDVTSYADFVEGLAERYFHMVYLDGSKLNAINTPTPGSFDEVILYNNRLTTGGIERKSRADFEVIYGDGSERSRGIPLFVFNYIDYKLWCLYDEEMRGEKLKENSKERREFFNRLGCSDFGLKVFDQFYFSRTRRSLEHYYPQAATGKDGALDQNQINCLGNYAMIGSEANSSGSNWSPLTKLDHYQDSSRKISQISVASIKFMIMMQICRDKGEWEFEEIKEHQNKMLAIILGDISDSGNNISTALPPETANKETTYEAVSLTVLRRQYWEFALQFIKEAHGPNGPFRNVTKSKEYWINGWFGISGFSIECDAKRKNIAVEVVLGKSNRTANKSAFDYLYGHKEEIEAQLGVSLNWWRYDKGKASYVDYHIDGIGIDDRSRWTEMAEFHAEWSKKFYDVIVPFLREWDSQYHN